MRRGAVALAVALLCPAVPAAAEDALADRIACPAIACVDGLTLDVPPERAWPAGDYVFKLSLDGKAMTCRGSLPFKVCDEPGLVCDGEGAMITQSGCAMPPETHGFGSISIPSGPAQVAVNITHNGSVMLEKNYTPAYREASFGPAACNIRCRQATLPLFGE